MAGGKGFEGESFRFPDETVQLGECLGMGGEGAVHSIVGDQSTVVKVFWEDRREEKAPKVRAMVENPVEDPTFAQNGVRTILWPDAVGEDSDTNRFLGYRMPYNDLSEATDALRYALEDLQWDQSTPEHRQQVALNLALTVEKIHQDGHAVCDFNHQDIFVKDGFVTLIDCDRIAIQGPDQMYSGDMYMPRYMPPEQREDTMEELQEIDRFGLGVHIFQFLMEGFHPFMAQGPMAANGDFGVLIRENQFPYGTEHSDFQPHDDAPDYDQLSTEIRELFDWCFQTGLEGKGDDGFVFGGQRPTASDWIDALSDDDFGTSLDNDRV